MEYELQRKECCYGYQKVNLDIVIGVTSAIPDTEYPEVAFAGKSNVGKSSLINSLMNRKSYARTSSQPGKTQTINFIILMTVCTLLTFLDMVMRTQVQRLKQSGQDDREVS